MAITTGSFPKFLWPGINSSFGLTYKQYDNGAQWKQIYSLNTSNKNYEEDVSMTGVGLVGVKNEGDAVVYETMKQGYVSRYLNLTYAKGFIITQEEIEDEQYPELAAKRSRNLAIMYSKSREIVGANILNRAFNSSYTGGDGKELCATDHPIESGTAANELAVAADLSEAALEQAIIDVEGFIDDRATPIATKPTKLIVPRQLGFEAQRILKNPDRPDTADRDINAMYSMNSIRGGFAINHYLTDENAWFLITDCVDGLKYFDRIPVAITQDNDFDTTNLKYKVRGRYSFGWSDWRGIFGSPGA